MQVVAQYGYCSSRFWVTRLCRKNQTEFAVIQHTLAAAAAFLSFSSSGMRRWATAACASAAAASLARPALWLARALTATLLASKSLSNSCWHQCEVVYQDISNATYELQPCYMNQDL